MIAVHQHLNHFTFANAGDSRAIVIGKRFDYYSQSMQQQQVKQQNKIPVIIAQTRDHKPELPDEAYRVLNEYEG